MFSLSLLYSLKSKISPITSEITENLDPPLGGELCCDWWRAPVVTVQSLGPCSGVCRSKLNTPDGGATPTSLPAAGESSSGVYFSHRCALLGRTIEASCSDVRGRVPHHTSGLESTVRDSEVRSKYRLSITKGASRGRQ